MSAIKSSEPSGKAVALHPVVRRLVTTGKNMTIEEFNATGWTAGMTARYSDGRTYPIASCDFGEQLVGLRGVVQNEPDEISWVRCENITLNAKPSNAGHKPRPEKETI